MTVNIPNIKARILVTFHTAAVVAFVALVGFAAEQIKCAMETPVLTRNGCINLKMKKCSVTIQSSTSESEAKSTYHT